MGNSEVTLSVRDKAAQDLLWEYAQRRRAEYAQHRRETDAEFVDALEAALKAEGFTPPVSAEDVMRDRTLDFTYGNLAVSNNHKPEYLAFKKLATDMGWSEERFVAWANKRHWWRGSVLDAVPARTEDQLVQLRTRNIERGGPKGGYTCDDCGARSTCAFVFDAYNTSGDCLAEK